MTAKISWHRYGTKLRHCHPMYILSSCLLVRPPQAGIVSKWRDELSCFCHGGFLPPVPHCVMRKFGYIEKIRVLLCGTLPQTLDLENFANQIDRVVNKTRRRSSLLTTPRLYDSRRVVAVYDTSVNRNPLTPLLQFVVDLLYNLWNSWQDFDWHGASRGPSAVAERRQGFNTDTIRGIQNPVCL